jgi:hypothetical protein
MAASNFAAITQPSKITGMQLRLAIGENWRPVGYLGSTWPDQNISLPIYSVTVSKPSAGLASDGEYLSLTPTFASYEVAPVNVYNAALNIATGAFAADGGAVGMHSFGPAITFSTPYMYTPGDGLMLRGHVDRRDGARRDRGRDRVVNPARRDRVDKGRAGQDVHRRPVDRLRHEQPNRRGENDQQRAAKNRVARRRIGSQQPPCQHREQTNHRDLRRQHDQRTQDILLISSPEELEKCVHCSAPYRLRSRLGRDFSAASIMSRIRRASSRDSRPSSSSESTSPLADPPKADSTSLETNLPITRRRGWAAL